MNKTTYWIDRTDKGIEELRELLQKCDLPFEAQHDIANKIARIRDDLYMAKKTADGKIIWS